MFTSRKSSKVIMLKKNSQKLDEISGLGCPQNDTFSVYENESRSEVKVFSEKLFRRVFAVKSKNMTRQKNKSVGKLVFQSTYFVVK